MRSLLFATYLALAAGSDPGLDEPFSLRIGESMKLPAAGLELRFLDVPRDSRCPLDVSCIMAGEAQVVIQAVSEDGSAELVFKLPPKGSDRQSFEGFSVTVAALEPQTEEARPIAAADFVATLVVTASAE